MRKACTTSIAIAAVLIWGIFKFMNIDFNGSPNQPSSPVGGEEILPVITSDINYLPESGNKNITHHGFYSLAYNDKLEVPEWVAYKLTEESLRIKNVPRAKRFKQDNKVKGRSAKHSDYSHSGYTRGHMAPAGDMAFSTQAMQESFYMSNMCPQLRNFNNGIWRELEENVRDWAYDNDELYIVSGPIFNSSTPNRIGKANVAVPDAFFKAILDYKGNKKKALAFLIPHEKSDLHLKEYAIDINTLENKTGFDFFDDLIEDDQEEEALEGNMDFQKWPIDRKRFNQRINHWNNQK